MSTMEQVVENLESADRSSPNILTEEELKIISSAGKVSSIWLYRMYRMPILHAVFSRCGYT